MSTSFRGFEEALATAVHGEIDATQRSAGHHAVASGRGTSVVVTGGTVVIGDFPQTKKRSTTAFVAILTGTTMGLICALAIYALSLLP